jgi:integrase
MGVSSVGVTVADVCRSYVEDLKTRKSAASASDAEGRFSRLVYSAKIGKIQLAKLKTTDVRAWLNAQIDIGEDEDEEDARKAKDSANRNLSALKAALNQALDGRLVATDAGWKTVKPFRDVGMRRIGFLTMEERRKLIDVCPADLASLIKALLLTAARPGELAGACVSDFDKGQGTLSLSGKTGHRVVTLSTAAKAFFVEVTKNRIANAPLLPREYGDHWNKDAWKKMFRQAVRSAELPATTVMYTLRHIAITELVNSGMDSFVVAQLAGTSTAMIDKHYGHLRHDKTRARLDAVRMV